MPSEKLLPPWLELLPAPPDQEPVLANLLELYAHDLSELFDVPLQPDGRFGYPVLSRYWEEEGRHPFLVKADGQLAGFVLVSRGSRVSGDAMVWDMAEFFIVRRYRKRGIGAAVAGEVWRRFPGPWEVRVLEANEPALVFWRAATRAFSGSGVQERPIELQRKRWRLLSFVSPEVDTR